MWKKKSFHLNKTKQKKRHILNDHFMLNSENHFFVITWIWTLQKCIEKKNEKGDFFFNMHFENKVKMTRIKSKNNVKHEAKISSLVQ